MHPLPIFALISPPAYVLVLKCETKFHMHIKDREKLWLATL